MSNTDEPYVGPPNRNADPLPSVEIMVDNIFTGFHTRGMTAQELGLTLSPEGHWISAGGE